MAGPAFQISSRNTMLAPGRYLSVRRSYLSSSLSFLILIGPKISSGVLNLLIKYSKLTPSRKAYLRRRAIKLLPTPGGPSRKMLSPATAVNNARRTASSRSYRPALKDCSSRWVRVRTSLLTVGFIVIDQPNERVGGWLWGRLQGIVNASHLSSAGGHRRPASIAVLLMSVVLWHF